MSTKTTTILVVDDDPRNRKLLETLLRADGYAVLSAASGSAAIDAVLAHAPDLVLLDVMMPDMDGFDVARRLKSQTATQAIPLVIVTALDDVGSAKRLAAVGVEAMLRKPIDRWELKALLKKLLNPVVDDQP